MLLTAFIQRSLERDFSRPRLPRFPQDSADVRAVRHGLLRRLILEWSVDTRDDTRRGQTRQQRTEARGVKKMDPQDS